MDNVQHIVASMAPIDFKQQANFRGMRTIGEIDGALWGIIGIDGSNAYHKLASAIQSGAKISDNYTVNDIHRAVDNKLLELDRTRPPTDKAFISEIRALLPVRPQTEYTVWRHVYGLRASKRRTLGAYTFHETKDLKELFRGPMSELIEWDKSFGEYVASTKVRCVSRERAVELADEQFTRLELLFASLIGPSSAGYFVRILRAPGMHPTTFALKSAGSNGIVGQRLSGAEHATIDLDGAHFEDPFVRRMFDIISTPMPTGIALRLVRAIEWIGRGSIARSSAEAIICYCAAMESMLVREKNAIVAPSIVSSLAEYCAFLLGSGYAQRAKIETHVKEVYSERSAVAHGGKREAGQEILMAARNLALELVVVISLRMVEGMTSDVDLAEHIRKSKYGA